MRNPLLLPLVVGALCLAQNVGAADLMSADYACQHEEKAFLVSGGVEQALEKEIVFPFAIKIQTNGVYTVNDGRNRTLKEGQRLGKDGMLFSPDGSLIPVMDHVERKGGRVLLFKDGEVQVPTQEIRLEDGTRITSEAMVHRPNGKSGRMMDGQMYLLTGALLASRDTVTFLDGSVILQKDGSRITMPPTQSMAMNDGTKVFGNGTIKKPDGQTVQLTNGQVMVVEGVATTGF